MDKHRIWNWDNFADDEVITGPITDDEAARKVISQQPAAQRIYNILREDFGYTILDALLYVLHAQAGDPIPPEVEIPGRSLTGDEDPS